VSDSSTRVVSVEIFGQRFPIRSALEPGYVSDLATYVDERMRVVAEETPAGDSLKLAILTALNIADELMRCQRGEGRADGLLAARAVEIERLVDRALALADGPVPPKP
jgi:cell division protein ZapA